MNLKTTNICRQMVYLIFIGFIIIISSSSI